MDTNIFRTKAGHRLASFGGIGHGLRLERTVGTIGTIGTMLEGKAPWKAMVFPRSYHSIWDLRLKFWGVLSNSSLLPVILNHSETLGDLPHRPNRLWLMVCFHQGQCDVFLETILEGAGPFNPILMLNTPTSGSPKWIVQNAQQGSFWRGPTTINESFDKSKMEKVTSQPSVPKRCWSLTQKNHLDML